MCSTSKEVSIVESMISSIVSGVKPSFLLRITEGTMKVRTFYDSGILRVATTDDILVEPGIDSRVDTVMQLTNDIDWPVDHPLCDFEFEGELNDLYNKVIELSGDFGLYHRDGRKRREGARKAQRTKLRR